jgi:hypothetical protein
MTTMAERVTELGITLAVADGPEWKRDQDGWEHNAYRIRLRRRATADTGARSITVPWMQGMAHQGAPDAATVLNAIVGDTVTHDNAASFDGFLAEFGTDTEDRAAVKAQRKIWAALERQSPKVRAFLGDDFDAVAFDTDRL